MMKGSREKIDLSVYVRAFAVFARNPTVIVLPLLAGVIGILVELIAGASLDGFIGGLTLFLVQLLQLFAFGVSIIIADQGWRRGNASFDDAWQDARRKSRDILFAAFGYTFVLNIAQYAGSLIGGFGIILVAIAMFGLVFAIAAAAIGGIPGGGAINVSIERVRSAPIAAGILTAVSLILASHYVDAFIFQGLGIEPTLVTGLIQTAVQSVFIGYVAVVTAKVYTDVSFTMPRW
jgi:hypothetical protein